MAGAFDRIYARLPVLGQHAAVTAFGAYWYWLRLGPGFVDGVARFRARERFSSAEWRGWQCAQVRSLLALAANHVPHYRSTWGSEARAAAKRGVLADIPLLEKQSVRRDARAFVVDRPPAGRELRFHTSGSTGTPVETIWTVRELRESMALREARSAAWAGVSFRERRATFSGRLVVPDPDSRGPFHRVNAVEGQVYLSAFHLRPETAAAYVDALRANRVRWLTGYAVSYFLLATMIRDQGLRVPPLAAVITTSEKVTPEMRRIMESAYGCRVYEEYSTVENTLFASECEAGRLHVSPDAGVVEILRPDGSPCDAGEVGEVVATALFRRHQPLIRYRLGDLAAWDPEPCSCGRALPVIREVVGRMEDVVIGPDGRQLVRFHGVFVDQPNVREGQIVQEARDRIRVRIVATDGYSEADERDIIGRVKQRLGWEVAVFVERVSSIPRTSAGKYRTVVSLLPTEGRERVPVA